LEALILENAALFVNSYSQLPSAFARVFGRFSQKRLPHLPQLTVSDLYSSMYEDRKIDQKEPF
jgi:hypothetical protein